jgi:broad specificity phosphatase PhoE
MSGSDVVLVRHGETAWSKSGQHTSRTDIPLTERGQAQAAGLAARLAGRPFALVLTSPLARARQTCALAGFADVAQVDDDLTEWDYGSYEGRTTAQIRGERPGWTLWDDGAPGGETAAEVAARADRVLARVRSAHGDSLVFAHGHLLRVLVARWLGLAPAAGRYFVLDAAGISVLGWEREQAVVASLNVGIDERP